MNAERWQQTKADRERHARTKQANRRARARRMERKRNGAPVDSEKAIRLPIGPFRSWLVELEAKSSRRDVAALLGVDQKRIYAWLNTAVVIYLDSVDSALCRAGDSYLLGELYPELYQSDEERAA